MDWVKRTIKCDKNGKYHNIDGLFQNTLTGKISIKLLSFFPSRVRNRSHSFFHAILTQPTEMGVFSFRVILAKTSLLIFEVDNSGQTTYFAPHPRKKETLMCPPHSTTNPRARNQATREGLARTRAKSSPPPSPFQMSWREMESLHISRVPSPDRNVIPQFGMVTVSLHFACSLTSRAWESIHNEERIFLQSHPSTQTKHPLHSQRLIRTSHVPPDFPRSRMLSRREWGKRCPSFSPLSSLRVVKMRAVVSLIFV